MFFIRRKIFFLKSKFDFFFQLFPRNCVVNCSDKNRVSKEQGFIVLCFNFGACLRNVLKQPLIRFLLQTFGYIDYSKDCWSHNFLKLKVSYLSLYLVLFYLKDKTDFALGQVLFKSKWSSCILWQRNRGKRIEDTVELFHIFDALFIRIQ